MFLPAIGSLLQAYVPAALESADVKAASLIILYAEPQPSDQKCVEILKKDVHVEMIFNLKTSSVQMPYLVYYQIILFKGCPIYEAFKR